MRGLTPWRNGIAAVAVVLAVASCADPGNGSQSSATVAPPATPADATAPSGAPASTPPAAQPAETPKAPDMSANPCKLVTPADLAEVRNGVHYILSVPGDPKVTDAFAERACAYESRDGSQVMILAHVDDAPGGSFWQAIEPLMQANKHDVVTGIGDQAYLEQETTITFRKGKVVLEISFLGEELTLTVKDQLKALAKKAAARIRA